MFSGVWKLCQRRLYSWLSSRCGLPVCIIGILIAIISAFQFGEVLLEWSKERYAVQFSIYADNIVGKSFESRLCPLLPIDIVYTWVNGSDPVLLSELKDLKQTLERKNATTHDETNSTNSSNIHEIPVCPFRHCVQCRTLIIDAVNLTDHKLTVENLEEVFPSLEKSPVNLRFINSSNEHTSPVFAVQMTKEDDVDSIIESGLSDKYGAKIAITKGFLTTDHTLVGGVKFEDYAIVVSEGIRPINNSRLLRKWMDSHFPNGVVEADVKVNHTAVVKFKPHILEGILNRNDSYSYSGAALTLFQAYIIWLPFSLPGSSVDSDSLARGDIISASRFEDNEELRYSLRSVEKFAPWVQHIYIVTNGQIPSWLSLDNPRLTVVTHKEIFQNQSHLPTYSSPAIESHLHQIPGLSSNFIYLNDDVMFGAEVWPDDFYTNRNGQKVYPSWPVPHCADGCPPNWILDHYCDQACNNSACDWDGGDCANSTRGGGGGAWSHSFNANAASDYCSPGCINTWLGDRYCDTSCRVPNCGYDAGDCGTDRWDELLSYQILENGTDIILPLGTKAVYFNLTEIFPNGTITLAEYTATSLVRTAVVAQRFKTLSITLKSNVTQSTVNFTIGGKLEDESPMMINFTITGDSATVNESLIVKDTKWSFNFTDSQAIEFLEKVSAKIQDAEKSVNYWVTERPSVSHTPPPPTSIMNYTITNTSHLPDNVSLALKTLEQEYHDGDLTDKGFLKRKIHLLEPYRHLLVANGTVLFGQVASETVATTTVGGNDNEKLPPAGNHLNKHTELFAPGGRGGGGGGIRRLLQLSEPSPDERHHASMIEKGKWKQLHREKELKKAVDEWEKKYGRWDPSFVHWESRRRLPWEKLRIFPESHSSSQTDSGPYATGPIQTRRLMDTDTFADSLRFVNKLYTKVYGHQARKVPAHMPHFIQKEVMVSLQERFKEEFDMTSSHQLRHTEDMQFAFSYFYYLMSEKKVPSIERIFARLDTDKSGILSVRELRTLLAKISKLPIDVNAVTSFEKMLKSCDMEYNGTRPSIEPILFETLYDPDIPLVTLNFTLNCASLVEQLKDLVKTQPKYKFEEIVEGQSIGFKMISENASRVITDLDDLRKEEKKFICLNDNINHEKEGAELAKLILVDFYESLFPIPSQFELPPEYRNRFLHIDKLNEWLRFRDRVQTALYTACFLLLLLCVVSLFYGKLVQWKRKLTRYLSSFHFRTRTKV